MKVRPLIISPPVLADVARLKKYAQDHRMNLHDIMRSIKSGVPVGNDPQFRIVIPVGYRVVYSIEQQPAPLGWCHHVSVAVDEKGKWPHEAAVAEIAKLFDIQWPSPNAALELEHEAEAVNLVYPIEVKA